MNRWAMLVLACIACEPVKELTLDGEQCLTCHTGVEPIHPDGGVNANDCVVCHGGDPKAKTLKGAHVAVPDDWADIRGEGLPDAPHGYIKDMAPDQLDRLDPAYVRFINP